MNIAVIGTGYVGLCTAVSFANWGHDVIGVDVDETRIQLLERGQPPFYEDGLGEELKRLRKSGKLQFTTSHRDAVELCEVLYVCVGTPSDVDGNADLTYVDAVARNIGASMASRKLVVIKSTVPVGTGERVEQMVLQEQQKRNLTVPFEVVSNPEFLREGRALKDALAPERIVVGCSSEHARRALSEVFEGVSSPVLFTTQRNAEMIKYASNAFLAARISFINEIARLCERTGADVTEVARGIGMDSRIGSKFLHAGIGYGGSCFPKDVKALLQLGRERGVALNLLEMVHQVNETQVEWFLEKVVAVMPRMQGKRLAILGLTFKPNTDDIREAPALKVIPYLIKSGAAVTAYDPKGSPNMKQRFPEIHYADKPYDAVRDADAVMVLTEWPEICDLEWSKVRHLMNGVHLFDGRNALNAVDMRNLGFHYVDIGRTAENPPTSGLSND